MATTPPPSDPADLADFDLTTRARELMGLYGLRDVEHCRLASGTHPEATLADVSFTHATFERMLLSLSVDLKAVVDEIVVDALNRPLGRFDRDRDARVGELGIRLAQQAMEVERSRAALIVAGSEYKAWRKEVIDAGTAEYGVFVGRLGCIATGFTSEADAADVERDVLAGFITHPPPPGVVARVCPAHDRQRADACRYYHPEMHPEMHRAEEKS